MAFRFFLSCSLSCCFGNLSRRLPTLVKVFRNLCLSPYACQMVFRLMFGFVLKSLRSPVFDRYESTTPSKSGDSSLLLPKLAFVGFQLALIAMGVYKCSAMGLLPTTASDWLAFMGPKNVSIRLMKRSMWVCGCVVFLFLFFWGGGGIRR